MKQARRWAGLLVAVAFVASASACSDDSPDRAARARTPRSVVLRGRLTIDGLPLEASSLGAVVLRHGLVGNCQATLPAVTDGRYEVRVLSATQLAGCGRRGTRVVLWAFAHDRFFYSNEAMAWPRRARARPRPRSFDATFATVTPNGAAPPVFGLFGEVFDRRGEYVARGTRVEAFVGKTRCALAATRHQGDFNGYSMSVVGPDSRSGCDRGATLTFRIGGRPAEETVVNGASGSEERFLSVKL